MTTVLAVALGLLAVGLVVSLRRQASRFATAESRFEAEAATLEKRVAAAREREHRSLDALGEAQAELDSMTAELVDLREHIEDLDAEIEAADRLATDQAAELASMAIESEEIRGRLAGVQLDLAGARKESAELTARIDELSRASSLSELPDADVPASTADAAALWRLELSRSERTWLYSVGMPGDPSPFAEHPDPLRLAIETEAEALCGDVGAVIKVDVAGGLSTDPGTSLLVLRLSQEVLAAAARLQEPSSFTVCRNGDSIDFSLAPLSDDDILDVDLTDLVHRTVGEQVIVAGCSISLPVP